MPPLNCQSTKTLQLGALREDRAAAASAYKSLVDEEKRLRRIFPQNNSSRDSTFCTRLMKSLTFQARIIDTSPVLDAPVLYHGQSLTEKTMERYGPSLAENPNQLHARKGVDSKLYP